ADALGKIIARYNPTKMAAFEGVFTTQEYTPIYGFGWVDMEERKVHGLGIPGGLSFLVHGNFQEPVAGLDQFPEEQWPWVPVVFQVYHLMVGMWGCMFVAACIGFWIWYTKRWQQHRWLLRFLVASVVFPQVASIAGWYSACMGRQPWLVHKLLLTKE